MYLRTTQHCYSAGAAAVATASGSNSRYGMCSLQQGGPLEHHITPSLTSITHLGQEPRNQPEDSRKAIEKQYKTNQKTARKHGDPFARLRIRIWVAADRPWVRFVIA